MSISALDKDTAKLLTTSQIVTSVSNAAKELIENSLDANAKNIEINLTENGAALIEVKDDGCGIAKPDIPNMALQSYTSKICNFSDLDTLETYGFRGEALYALSAVSDLTIITKTEEEEVAQSYTIDHSGHIVKSEPCHRATGTTVQVRQLFKQVPVRRQIITNSKKANRDIKILESLIKSYGICKFSIRMSYKVDNNIIFVKPSTTTLEDAVTYILGKKVTSNMSWINVESTEFNMKLMIPKKETQNMLEVFQSGAQYIFVNNRPIKDKELEKIITKSILEALNSSSKKPIFILYILINAANIDVNLEPNKNSILFKDQKVIFDTVDKYITDFYGIQREEQEENIFNESLNDYQKFSQMMSNNDEKTERPVSKKRKLCTEERDNKRINEYMCIPQKSDDNKVKNQCHAANSNSTDNEEAQIAKNEKNDEKESGDSCMEISENFNVALPTLNLSETDSNNSQNFTLICDDDDDISNDPNNKNTKKDTDDSPPFELTPHCDTFSQLPIVDLGEDFNFEDILTRNTEPKMEDISDKENKTESANAPVLQSKKNKSVSTKCVTLKEWSKGHVPGIKGGTDVQPYIDKESNKSLESETHGNTCEGFVKFSNHMKSKIVEKNPTMTASQIAYALINLWKKLSSEERGYYRDLAQEEKVEHNKEKEETKENEINAKNCNTNKRLKKILEKMNAMNIPNKHNLLMRTIVPWDMDLKKVTEGFLNEKACNNANFIVGLLSPNLWIVHKSAHIWILDTIRLKKELNVSDANTNEESTESIEQLLKQWFSEKDDLSVLHPIHLLT
ncbi:uncharacterized protein LOC143348537 [Colletes latitarsis]|uniref:uncharacterized protein LOC143348537 n=1 Tax=Colletes latitarsis TaxID=2605962 RepID=UPI004035DAB4